MAVETVEKVEMFLVSLWNCFHQLVVEAAPCTHPLRMVGVPVRYLQERIIVANVVKYGSYDCCKLVAILANFQIPEKSLSTLHMLPAAIANRAPSPSCFKLRCLAGRMGAFLLTAVGVCRIAGCS